MIPGTTCMSSICHQTTVRVAALPQAFGKSLISDIEIPRYQFQIKIMPLGNNAAIFIFGSSLQPCCDLQLDSRKLDFLHPGTDQLSSMEILNLLIVLGVGVFGSLLAIPSGVVDGLSVADKADEDGKPLLKDYLYMLLHFPTLTSYILAHSCTIHANK